MCKSGGSEKDIRAQTRGPEIFRVVQSPRRLPEDEDKAGGDRLLRGSAFSFILCDSSSLILAYVVQKVVKLYLF